MAAWRSDRFWVRGTLLPASRCTSHSYSQRSRSLHDANPRSRRHRPLRRPLDCSPSICAPLASHAGDPSGAPFARRRLRERELVVGRSRCQTGGFRVSLPGGADCTPPAFPRPCTGQGRRPTELPAPSHRRFLRASHDRTWTRTSAIISRGAKSAGGF